jgi:hypothetical protein
MRTAALISVIAAGLVLGCAKEQKQESKPSKSTLQTAIDGTTGRTAVEAGKRAQTVIKDVSAQRNADLNEALGE